MVEIFLFVIKEHKFKYFIPYVRQWKKKPVALLENFQLWPTKSKYNITIKTLIIFLSTGQEDDQPH